MSYVYQKREGTDTLWVGFYAPDGKWHHETEWHSASQAAERVHYLNGGQTNEQVALTRGHIRSMDQLAAAIRNMPHSVRMRP